MITTHDGQQIQVKDGEWVFFNPAGEVVGCMYANAWVASNSRRAMVQFWEGEREADKRLRDGYTAILMTRAQWEADIMPVMLGQKDG